MESLTLRVGSYVGSQKGAVRILNDIGTNVASAEALAKVAQEYFPHTKICDITIKQIRKGNWIWKTSILIVGGGEAGVRREALGERGMKMMAWFIEKIGGKAFLICAGAYGGSGCSIYDGKVTLIPTPLVKLTIEGPLSNPKIAESMELRTKSGVGRCYHQGGGAFHNSSSHPDVTVLATHTGAYTGDAVIVVQSGNGTVACSGPHPEFSVGESHEHFRRQLLTDITRSLLSEDHDLEDSFPHPDSSTESNWGSSSLESLGSSTSWTSLSTGRSLTPVVETYRSPSCTTFSSSPATVAAKSVVEEYQSPSRPSPNDLDDWYNADGNFLGYETDPE